MKNSCEYPFHIKQLADCPIDEELCPRLDRSRKDYAAIFDMLIKRNEARKIGRGDFDAAAAYEEWKLHCPPSAG